MAGIGFELKKVFEKKTMVSSVTGSLYAVFATNGSFLIFLSIMLFSEKLLYACGISELESLFFNASFTYLFLVAILVSAAFNTIISRFIADHIYMQKENYISSSIHGMYISSGLISGIILLILCIAMYMTGKIGVILLIPYYVLGLLATYAFLLMAYISALKDYKKITYAYLCGLITFAISYLAIYFLLKINPVIAMYWALMLAFLVIDSFLVFFCLKAFGKGTGSIFKFLKYFKKFPGLFFSGFAYMLGFYITNIVYWLISDLQLKISIFRVAPNYDFAMFVAILCNFPALVIFVVKIETEFFEKYTTYLSALNKGTYQRIEKSRKDMIENLRHQLYLIYDTQLFIVILCVALCHVVLPFFAISSQVITNAMVLCLGLYCVFCMYFTVVILYYFEDLKSSWIAPSVFLGVTFVSAVICALLGNPCYPFPLLLGGIASFITGFALLKHRLENIDAHLLCYTDQKEVLE